MSIVIVCDLDAICVSQLLSAFVPSICIQDSHQFVVCLPFVASWKCMFENLV